MSKNNAIGIQNKPDYNTYKHRKKRVNKNNFKPRVVFVQEAFGAYGY